MTTSGLPFDDIRNLAVRLPEPDTSAMEQARRHLDVLALEPAGRAGRPGEIAVWHAGWSGRFPGVVSRPLAAVFAGTHGIARRWGGDETTELALRVAHCAAGGAAINQICAANDIGLKVFDLALDVPTGDIALEAAFDERGCAATIAFGMEAIAGGTGLLCLGALDAGRRIADGAIVSALTGVPADALLERGPEAALADEVVALNRGGLSDPFEALRRMGSREIAALTGAIVAARHERVPVILDGSAAMAAAAIVYRANPAGLDHCRLATLPGQAWKPAAGHLGLEPILDLDWNFDGAAGAAWAVDHVRTAVKVMGNLVPLSATLQAADPAP